MVTEWFYLKNAQQKSLYLTLMSLTFHKMFIVQNFYVKYVIYLLY